MNKKLKLIMVLGLILLLLILVLYIYKDSILASLNYDPNRDYITTLKTSPLYDDAEKVSIKFTYEDPQNADLIKLRSEYKLEQIAGTGSDFEKAKNLLKWVNGLILQDGNAALPKERDALSLINFAKQNNQGLNCRGLAIILNETLLSVGIKSRYLSLVPRDFSVDSHVVVMAYISQFGKWIYLDPSYNAYFLDDNNIPMSPQEIRDAFINGKTPQNNADITWGGRPMDVVYPHYISKNIYRFISPVDSSVGYDSKKTKKSVVLNPKGDNIAFTGNIFTNTIIHNKEVFWAKP